MKLNETFPLKQGCEIELGLEHEELDYDEVAESVEPPAKRRKVLTCPACGQNSQNQEILERHWLAKHSKVVVMFLCLNATCGVKKTSEREMKKHLRAAHNVDSTVAKLPWLCQTMPNRYVEPHPTDGLSPPVPDPAPPANSLPFKKKKEVVALLENFMASTSKLESTSAVTTDVAEVSTHTTDEKTANLTPKPDIPIIKADNSSNTTGKLFNELTSIDAKMLHLQAARNNCAQRLECQLFKELDAAREEMKALKARNHYLTNELAKVKDQGRRHHLLPAVVGDLERVATTRAFIVFPERGHSSVFPLQTSDYDLLDLENRLPCLSSESL